MRFYALNRAIERKCARFDEPKFFVFIKIPVAKRLPSSIVVERLSIPDLMAHAEAELAKARENPDSENPESDIAKWEELLEGLRILQDRRAKSE